MKKSLSIILLTLALAACAPKGQTGTDPLKTGPQAPANVLAYIRAENTFDEATICSYLADKSHDSCSQVQSDMEQAKAVGLKPGAGQVIGVHPTLDGGTVTAYYQTATVQGQTLDVSYLIYTDKNGLVTKIE